MDVDRRLVVVAAAVLLVAAGSIGVLVGTDLLAGNTDDVGPAPTPRSTGDDGSASGSTGGDGTPVNTPPPPFSMVVESVESCGQTCRDVTATLTNNQDRQATGVTVETTIHAGGDTGGDVIWEGSREIGNLDPGESTTDTTRIELGLFDAAAVKQAGGEITIVLAVDSDQQSVRFVRHRDVA